MDCLPGIPVSQLYDGNVIHIVYDVVCGTNEVSNREQWKS